MKNFKSIFAREGTIGATVAANNEIRRLSMEARVQRVESRIHALGAAALGVVAGGLFAFGVAAPVAMIAAVAGGFFGAVSAYHRLRVALYNRAAQNIRDKKARKPQKPGARIRASKPPSPR